MPLMSSRQRGRGRGGRNPLAPPFQQLPLDQTPPSPEDTRIIIIYFFLFFYLTHRIYLFKVQTSHAPLGIASKTSTPGPAKTRKPHDSLVWAQPHIPPKETPSPILLSGTTRKDLTKG